MNPFVAYLQKMFLVSGVLYAYYHLALRDNRFHQWNRFYLLATVLLSITLPLFQIPIPEAPVNDNRLLFAVMQLLQRGKGVEKSVTGPSQQGLSWIALAGYIYMGIALIQFCLLGIRLTYLRRLHQRSPLIHLDGITLVETNDKGAPFSFFHWVFWNKDMALDSSEGRHILRHELTHVRQGHSMDKIVLQIVCILFFPVIFFYLIQKELQLIHEYLADKQATANEDRYTYAQLLVSQTFQASPYAFANSFFQHPLKRRLAMMTRFSNPRFTYLRKVMFLPLALLLFGLLAFRVEETHPMLAIRIQKAAEGVQQIFSGQVTPAKKPDITFSAVPARTRTISASTPPVRDTVPNRMAIPQTILHFAGDSTYGDSVLYVVDGKPLVIGKSYTPIEPSQISSVSVLSGRNATRKYGAAGANGVIEITTNSKYPLHQENYSEDKVFTKVEVEAQFPGGDVAWNEFIKKTITTHMDEIQKDSLSGTCEVMFVVNKDGSVAGTEALSMRNSALAKYTVEAIANGPHWIPATQNGHIVAAFRKQRITFVMPN